MVASITVEPDRADAQVNAIAVSTAPAFPSTVTVGDQNQPGLLALTNNSVGNLSTQPVTITNIRLNPSCVSAGTAVGAEPCTQPEPRLIPGPIFNIDPIATGRASTACAGIFFAVSPPNANGTVTFTPTAPVILAPVTTGGATTTCIIDFTFDVTQRPIDGQTFAVAFVDAAAPNPTPPPAIVPAFNIPGTSSIITVAEAPTTIVTQASPQTLEAGGVFSDTATVTGVPGGPPLTDSVVFTLYRSLPGNPGFPTCTAGEAVTTSNSGVVQVVAGPNAPNGAPTATATFTPLPLQPAGRYVFVATYDPPGGPNPDSNYLPSTSACNDPLERVTITPILPTIAVEKTAVPTSMNEPGGTFTFNVRVINTGRNPLTLTSLQDNIYGNLNGQGTCATGATLAPGGGTYTCSFPGVFTGNAGAAQTDIVTAIGTDADGNTATAMDDAVVTLLGVPPVITVIKDAAPLTRPEPGGSFTFTVRVRNDSAFEAVTITTLTDNIYGDLAIRPGSTCGALIGTVLAPGATSVPCSFPGDFFGNAGATQTDIVTATAVDNDGQTATDTDDAIVGITDVLPTVQVVKTAAPTTMPAPGGTFTFSAVVTNTSPEPIVIQTLTDDIYGNLAIRPGSTCGALIGTTLAPGASSPTCTFPGVFTGAAGATQTDVVTVTATDNDGNTATDSDDATVTITGAPSIRVDKTANPSTLPEPGGTFTFTAVVTNTGPEPLTIIDLDDNIYGDLAAPRPGSTCNTLIGTTLAPGASSAPCSFTGPFFGPGGATQTDIVTVRGQSPAGTIVMDDDDATVGITNVVPVIAVDKTASPLTRPAPGGTFTFQVIVRNPSAEPLTITALTDNIYGNLVTIPGSTCGALIGTVLAPGASSAPCTFPGNFTGPAGAAQTDIVTVTGTDDEGTVVTASDDATVSIINIVPDIDVDKRATPQTRPAPGGAFTFDVLVTNTGPNPLTITTLTDNIYGNIATQGSCTTAIGTVLPTGGTYACAFTGTFTGLGGASQTDIVTVVGTDANGTTATDADDATVTLTNVLPTVRVVKTATPTSRPEPGGAFTFTAVVTNTSAETVTITTLTDDIYGNLATRPGSTCGALIGTTLAPGASSAPCSFSGNFFGDAGAVQTDIVTVVVTDAEGTTATDTDDATVTITDIPPTINVVKTATPLSQTAPGGTFTFNVVVTNTSFEPVTITSLTDDIYGSLNGRGTCAIGATLAPSGGTYSCSFTGPFTGPAGASQTDTVSVIAVDSDGTTVTDTDDATVTLTAVPTIRVDKSADPSSLPEPGGTFTFTVVVTNTSGEVLTITDLDDDIYGDLAAPRPGSTCNTLIGTTLAPGASSAPCTFTGPFTGPAGAAQTDIVTVVGQNPAGVVVTDTDDAIVRITNVAPVIAVVKTANPLTLPAPGGTFTFTVVVSNPGTEAVTVTAVTDDIYGNLATRPGSTCGALIGTVLAPGATSAPCTFTGAFAGAAGAAQTDVVTVTGTDDDGTVVTATDDATVSIINIVPDISVEKSATPTTRPAPGGPFTFSVVVTNTGPNALTITTLTDDIYGNIATQGTCTTAIGTVLPSGGSYACAFPGTFTGLGGAAQTDVVTVTGTDVNGTVVNDTDDATVTLTNVLPTVRVDKTANPLVRPEPGGTFTFTAVVTNTSAETVTITSLTDDIYGNLATRPGSTCGALIGTTLAPGASSAPCTFTGDFTGAAGASQTDVVTVVVTDTEGTTATDTDDATVTIIDLPPTINVVKTATPTTRPAPGGTFTFNVVVTNTGPEAVTITSLTDDVYGNLNGQGTCALGAVIPVGGTYSCSFTGTFTGAAGDAQTDVVTVLAVDNDGTTVTDTDDATVNLTGAPSILVDKAASPSSLPEPGGTFTFTVVVTNTSPAPLTITDLDDDIYGDLAAPRPGSTCNTLIGTVLAPAASSAPCTFTGAFTGPGGASQTDVVTVVGQNAAGTIVTDTDDATVSITNVAPVLAVNKTANPLTLPAPGGSFTFTVVVTNPGTEPVTLTGVTDDIYGNLVTRPGSTCGALIGTVLAGGASSAPCTFTGNFAGAAGASQTDVVTVTGTDDEGTVVTATDDATVSIINIVPDISVDKRATPTTRPAPGGAFTFDVVVTNVGPNSLTITSLTDDIYGNIATQGTCTTAIGTVLPSGGSYACAFTGSFIGIGGATQTDVVTVTGTDINGTTVGDSDDATVSLVNVVPTVAVVKTAAPLTLPEPGGLFTFTAVVTNTSGETVTVTSLTDDIYGNLATRPGSTCGALVGTTLAAGASSAPCTFPGNFIGDAGASQTDVVTVVVTDAEGTTATATDDATVTITDVPPTITLVKSATPTSRPAPGGSFTFDVVVTNTSFEPVTITSLVDNVYGSLDGRGTCAIGASLAPNGGTYTCSFAGDFTGVPNASQTDVVTVIAVDNDGTSVTASDDAVVTLGPLPVVLTTVASAGSVGSSVFDTATLAGGFNPTGTVTFRLYGPNPFNDPNPADNCSSAAIFTSVKPVTGSTDPRIVVSDTFILPAPGLYHFVATYSGDVNNAGTGPTECLDPNETIAAQVLPIDLTTTASPSVTIGGAIFDTAMIGGGFGTSGTLTFTVFGPDNPTCTGAPVFTSTRTVNGNGSYTSELFTPTAPGVYRFVARYSGDTNNAAAVTACDDPLERVTVTPLPVIQVVKTAVPDSIPAPGGNVVFNVAVTNNSNVALTIRTLTDDVYGDITKLTASTCATAIGTVLAPAPGPGNTYSCQFVAAVTGASGSTHTDVVTVTGTDSLGNTVTDTDQATVRITGVPPTIVSTKVATPTSQLEPGGSFSFAFTVTNTGAEAVTVTSLVDDIYGDLNGRGTCAIGARLPANGSYTCTFSGNFFGNAGATQTDVITVTARDDAGQTATSQSRATVRITDVVPTITVTKSPSPLSRPAPGGTFRFTVTVTNTSFEPVTITSLADDIYGNVDGRGSCAVGVRLVPGASYSCAFDGEFQGVAGASQTDTVTVVAVDDDTTSVTATAKATVSITPVGTPPVTPPPATPPPAVPPTQQPPIVPRAVSPPAAQQPLPRTGSDLSGPARLAGLLLLLGMMLVAATRNYGGDLRPAPVSGGGDGGWFAPPRPPQGPLGLGFTPPRPPQGPLDGLGFTPPGPPAALEATIVGIRSTGALDGAALDAAEAMSGPARSTARSTAHPATPPQAPPAWRRRRRR